MRVETLPLSEHAVLTAYLHSDSPDLRALEAVSRPAIIICPGGRYAFGADVERDVPAISFLNMGLQVFVLDYSVEPFAGDKRPLTDLALAMKLVRERSVEWQILPEDTWLRVSVSTGTIPRLCHAAARRMPHCCVQTQWCCVTQSLPQGNIGTKAVLPMSAATARRA